MAKYERKRGKESSMYIYYVLRGKQGGKQVELEGDIDEEHFPGVDLGDGREILSFLAQAVEREAGTAGEWEEAELTDFSLIKRICIFYSMGVGCVVRMHRGARIEIIRFQTLSLASRLRRMGI